MRWRLIYVRDALHWCADTVALRAGALVDAWLNRGYQRVRQGIIDNARAVNESER